MTPPSLIRAVVASHYGMLGMPLRILRREQEVEQFERNHPEVPPPLWTFVNHTTRLVHTWSRTDICIDLVVWCPASSSYRLVQDLCFKDAYPTAVEWHHAVLDLVKTSAEVWVVQHDE